MVTLKELVLSHAVLAATYGSEYFPRNSDERAAASALVSEGLLIQVSIDGFEVTEEGVTQ